jgi:ubiquinone/menaquinone biosynthesis C-methylase UbiE
MKRSARYERMAALYDREILPIWSERFGRMILRGLALPRRATVLDFACATGYPALEIAKRLDGGRVVCIDACAPLAELARQKAGDLLQRQIFVRTEELSARLAFADRVFDVVVSNLGLWDVPDPPAVLREMVRVTRPGGQVVVTLPLRGTFAEFFDIYHEVLARSERADALHRFDEHLTRLPEPEQAVGWMEGAGLRKVELEVDSFSLLFKSSREFLFAPVIEYGPLSAWKDIAGKGEEMQETFVQIREAIDAYFGGRPFELSVKAGCLRGTRGGPKDLPDLEVPRPEEVSNVSYLADEEGE